MHDELHDKSGPEAPEAPEALLPARLVQRRGSPTKRGTKTVSSDLVVQVVLMDHLVHDVALVRFARQVGIETESKQFSLPLPGADSP
jgi:hypothetical protein